MFFKDCLNTISSMNGANITDEKNMYSGALLSVVLIASSFPGIPCVSLFMNMFDIIIIISASMYSFKYFV